MPYIKNERKAQLYNPNDLTTFANPTTAGELNFYITTILQHYFKHNGTNYQAINDISGAMTECLAEFRRRVVVDYENKKIQENGDCY